MEPRSPKQPYLHPGLAAITPQEEPQLPLLPQVTVTTKMSSEAKTQQPLLALPSALLTPSLAPGAAVQGREERLWWPHLGGASWWGQEGHPTEGLGKSKMAQCKKRIWFHQ